MLNDSPQPMRDVRSGGSTAILRDVSWAVAAVSLAVVLPASPSRADAPAAGQPEMADSYRKPWGENRGFDVGQTLPDIPLIDLNGNEVRFSSFLGQRYVLFCWASW